jgi:hypothetical protein
VLEELMDIFGFLGVPPNSIIDLIERTLGFFNSITVIKSGEYQPEQLMNNDSLTAVITVYDPNIPGQDLFPYTVIKNYDIQMIGYHNTDGNFCILIKHKETDCFWKYTKTANTVSYIGLTEVRECNEFLRVIRSAWEFCVYI